MPQAASLAARIRQEFGLEPELIKGANGVFDVAVDGKLVYSKDQTGRFPDESEVIETMRGG
jgi:selenoprotein W-related protein